MYNNNQRKLIQKAPSYQEFLEALEQVVDVEEPEDTRTPLEMLEDWLSSSYTVIEHGQSDFEKILDIFKQRGVEFSN